MEDIGRSPVEGKVVYPIIYKVLAYIPGGWPWDFFLPSQAKVFEADCTRSIFADNYMFGMFFVPDGVDGFISATTLI